MGDQVTVPGHESSNNETWSTIQQGRWGHFAFELM
jgi:hypothetical protein